MVNRDLYDILPVHTSNTTVQSMISNVQEATSQLVARHRLEVNTPASTAATTQTVEVVTTISDDVTMEEAGGGDSVSTSKHYVCTSAGRVILTPVTEATNNVVVIRESTGSDGVGQTEQNRHDTAAT